MKNIPKILHLIWTNKAKMSWLQAITVISFHRLNPDWKIIVHIEKQTDDEMGKNVYVPDYTGDDYFYMIENLVEIREVDLIKEGISLDKPAILISDLLRMNILYREGGVYSDFDVVWLKPMDEFIKVDHLRNINDFEFMVCFSYYTKGWHNISVLISEIGSEFLKTIIDKQSTIQPPYDQQAYGTKMFNEMYPDYNSINFKRVLAIKYETFFPYSINEMDRLWVQNDLSVINNNVMGVHWFNGHFLSKKYVNNGLYECSMTSILKQHKYL